jgi:hypothetical protein
MNLNKDILDSPNRKVESPVAFKNRIPRDLMLVLGVLLTILGVYFVYVFSQSSFVFIELSMKNLDDSFYFRVWMMDTVTFVYGIALIIGGIGLIGRKKIGWIFSFATTIYAICLVSIGLIRTSIDSSLNRVGFFWGASLILLLSALMLLFLLSRPIRNYFKPTKRNRTAVWVILLIFTIHYAAVLLII